MLDVAVTVSNCPTSFVGPTVMPVRLTVCKPLSSFVVTLLIALNVGASFTEVTVRLTVAVAARALPLVNV